MPPLRKTGLHGPEDTATVQHWEALFWQPGGRAGLYRVKSVNRGGGRSERQRSLVLTSAVPEHEACNKPVDKDPATAHGIPTSTPTFPAHVQHLGDHIGSPAYRH